jgi:positive regulator of sigma E activity
MTEQGRVATVNGDRVWVMQDHFANGKVQCFGCMRKKECFAAKGLVEALNPHNFDLQAGSLVETELPARGIVLEALIAFLPLLAGFFLGWVFPALIMKSASSPARAFAGVVGLGVFGILSYLYHRRHPVKTIHQVSKVL